MMIINIKIIRQRGTEREAEGHTKYFYAVSLIYNDEGTSLDEPNKM